MNRIYLDHAATTAVNPKVFSAMEPFFSLHYGNPSSMYQEGREAYGALRRAREQVAAAIGAEDPSEIIFTGGGSEANNMAILGAAKQNAHKGKHIVTTAIEHHAVLHCCEALEKEGYEVSYLYPDAEGIVSVKQAEETIRPDTILVTVMAANNEIGSLQPIAEIGELARERGVLFHTDAVQAIGAIPIDVETMNLDMLSLSAHKFYGPKGVGALYLRKGRSILPLIYGGAQERGRRAGTENLPCIVGLGAAIERAVSRMPEESARLAGLQDVLVAGLEESIPNCYLNGPRGKRRLANNVNVSFPGVEGEGLLLNLDFAGVAASSGSACTSASLDPSHVLLAMGLPYATAHGSLRLTLGDENSMEDVERVLELLPPIVAKLRTMHPLFEQE